MSVRDDLNIPAVAKFIYGMDGEVHIGDMFGGTWCEDFYFDETGEYGGAIENDGPADEPLTEDGLHDICLAAAKDNE